MPATGDHAVDCVYIAQLEGVIKELLSCCMSGDESRLLLVASGGYDKPWVHERCDRIAAAMELARSTLNEG